MDTINIPKNKTTFLLSINSLPQNGKIDYTCPDFFDVTGGTQNYSGQAAQFILGVKENGSYTSRTGTLSLTGTTNATAGYDGTATITCAWTVTQGANVQPEITGIVPCDVRGYNFDNCTADLMITIESYNGMGDTHPAHLEDSIREDYYDMDVVLNPSQTTTDIDITITITNLTKSTGTGDGFFSMKVDYGSYSSGDMQAYAGLIYSSKEDFIPGGEYLRISLTFTPSNNMFAMTSDSNSLEENSLNQENTNDIDLKNDEELEI